MNETKKFWESQTLWGAGMAIVATIAGFFNIVITPEIIDLVVNDLRVLIVGIVSSVGAIWGLVDVIIGRVKATKRIE